MRKPAARFWTQLLNKNLTLRFSASRTQAGAPPHRAERTLHPIPLGDLEKHLLHLIFARRVHCIDQNDAF